ncbi:unnamed protein product [Protopolystoma xenopodis]|uniref:Uncharacterized protein n=1 Tax=Protopolystoma xenopodis TaxID=117903 RepID=A0A3S5B5T4_9PLAT|nr:unnamed protein product [Protopolystoma xenopodis]
MPVPLDLASMPKLPIDQHQFQTNSFASEGPNISSRRARSLALSTTEKPFDQCDDPITRCRHRYTTRSLRKTSTKSTCQTKSAIDEGAQRQAQIQQEMRFLSLRMDGLEVIASSIKVDCIEILCTFHCMA